MPCTNCNRDMPLAARGLCRACYSRWQKTGTTAYQRKGKRSICQIDGCTDRAISFGLCDKHRQRLRKHGSTDQTRPDSWGAIHKHPLFNAWAYLRRHRIRAMIDPTWVDDFLQFATDVGERPSAKHRFCALDETKPIGPKNFTWKTALIERLEGETRAEHAARSARAYRAVRNEAYKGYELKRRIGISVAEYVTLAEKQGHVCAICNRAEGAKIRGKTLSLAVDHCHTKGTVRGLLCADCNRGLGCFKDSPEALRRAAEYLEWPERLI